MDKQKLFSVGQISKQTGVNFNSLRYYEQLGILRPAYVDPQTSYRYYSFSQIHIIQAIQLCIELGIPLKQFDTYLEKDGQNINYAKLIEKGTSLAKEKIKTIEEKLNMLLIMQDEINHAEHCYHSSIPEKYFLPEKVLWLTPYNENQTSEKYSSVFKKTMLDISRLGLKVGYDHGLIMFCNNTETTQYFYIDIELPPEQIDTAKNLLYLPASDYLCISKKVSGFENAEKYFPEIFEKNCEKIIIETELFTGDFQFQSPIYELRCLVRD